MNGKVRQFHRWVAVAFTVLVAAYIVMMSVGGAPPAWFTYLPLLPLALLQFTGLYLLMQPWFAKRRDAQAG